MARIESEISSWNPQSTTSEINRNAGIRPVVVSKELYDLVYRSLKISTISSGYFDISFASIDKLWKFDGTQTSAPSSRDIAGSVSKINFKNIVLNEAEQSIFLREQGMKIGFGAIGKGYAADRAKSVMEKIGVQSGVVNAGGDIITWGAQPDGTPWTIGIADPGNKLGALSWMSISNKAVVTSGNYEKFIEIDGERYCHIINPKTGWPVKGLKSVTIIAESAEAADALATTVFVLGKDEGLKLINQMKGIECIVVSVDDEIFYSNNLQPKYWKSGKISD